MDREIFFRGKAINIENERRIIYISREPRVEVIGNIHDNPDLIGGGVSD